MAYQISFAEFDYTHKKRLTRREVFPTGRWKMSFMKLSVSTSFAGFGSVIKTLPDETTILDCRTYDSEKLLETINAYLKEKGLLVSQGTMVGATIIHAPSSIKNLVRQL